MKQASEPGPKLPENGYASPSARTACCHERKESLARCKTPGNRAVVAKFDLDDFQMTFDPPSIIRL